MRVGDRVEVISIPNTKEVPFAIGDEFVINKISKGDQYIRIKGGLWHFHKHFKVIYENKPQKQSSRHGRDRRLKGRRSTEDSDD